MGEGGAEMVVGDEGNAEMSAEGEASCSASSERMRGRCREKEAFFLTFNGAGARPAPGLLGGVDRALLCVGMTSSSEPESQEDVGDGAAEEPVYIEERNDEVEEKTESTEERMLDDVQQIELWRVSRTA